MPEDTPPAAVETITEKPKPQRKLLVAGAVLLVILLLLLFKPDMIFGAEGFNLTRIFRTDTPENNVPETIEINKSGTIPLKLTAKEGYVNMNLTLHNVTQGNVTTILVSGNESLETWKDIVEFYEGVESTEFKFVYSIQYGYRRYYFWWHNNTLLALDTTDIDKNLIRTMVEYSPPTDDLF